MKQPPKTKRYCLSCEKITEWEFNGGRGHSDCTECGGKWSRKEE